MERALKKLVSFAKAVGFDSFLFGIKANDHQVTFHYENMPIKGAMEMMILGFHQVVAMELERHPEYADDYVAIWRDMDKEFDNSVRKADGRFRAYKEEKEAKAKKK